MVLLETLLANALMLVDSWGSKKRGRSRSSGRGGGRGRRRSLSGRERELRKENFGGDMRKERVSREGTIREGTSREGTRRERTSREGTSREGSTGRDQKRSQSMDQESRLIVDSRVIRRLVTSSIWNPGEKKIRLAPSLLTRP